MKVKTKVIAIVLLALSMISCSEFLLIPITVEYPFSDDQATSPSKYTLEIEDGLTMIDTVLKTQTRGVTDEVAKPIKDQLEQDIATQFGSNATTEFAITYPVLNIDDFLELITGATVTKTIVFNATITVPGQQAQQQIFSESITFSICDFTQKNTFVEGGTKMVIENLDTFCQLSETDKTERNSYCNDAERTNGEMNQCIYLALMHENSSITILLAEQDELKDYKQYMNKIYSATLNELSFTITETPTTTDQTVFRFSIAAELFSQPVGSFKADGTECDSFDETGCTIQGVNKEGELENYFEHNPEIREKYLIGRFGTESINIGDKLDLEYTYDGKDILQTSIKKLNFQIGAKSVYKFFPQAGRPTGVLDSDLKAELFFNVEPLN